VSWCAAVEGSSDESSLTVSWCAAVEGSSDESSLTVSWCAAVAEQNINQNVLWRKVHSKGEPGGVVLATKRPTVCCA
jgi:hypothetical protein